MSVTLLGPQRRPTLDTVAASLRLAGPIVTITAGWQERESDDGQLSERLGSRDVNLSLYGRWLDVQDRSPDFAAAERRLRGVLEEVQEIYLLRLDHALQAVYAVQRRSGHDRLRADALAEAVAAVRELDAAHLHRISHVRGEFYQAWQPHDRPVIADHRAAIARLLGDAAALVVAGGHVGVLAHTLHLFDVAPPPRSPVIAWSAGAMALTDRIVLFHDRSPQGFGHPEVFGKGLGVLRASYRCRTPARGCCSTTCRGWPSSPADSHLPAVSCWRTAPGSTPTATGPARRAPGYSPGTAA